MYPKKDSLILSVQAILVECKNSKTLEILLIKSVSKWGSAGSDSESLVGRVTAGEGVDGSADANTPRLSEGVLFCAQCLWWVLEWTQHPGIVSPSVSASVMPRANTF
jgi:hypothetical protein